MKGVLRELKGRFKGVSMELKKNKDVSIMFRGLLRNLLFMRDWRVLLGRLKSVLRGFQRSFMDISTKFKGYFKKVSGVL